jgi:hypothetical protein
MSVLPYGHFDHVVACGSPFGNAEVTGHIDLGNYLAAFRLCLRKGTESQDFDQMLAYLVANKQRMMAILQPSNLPQAPSLPQLPALPGSLPQMQLPFAELLPQGLPFA